jgi:competence protein ComEA
MFKKFVKDYLSFTKRDRVGVLTLVTLIVLVALLPYLWPVKKPLPPSAEAIAALRREAAQLNSQPLKEALPGGDAFPENLPAAGRNAKQQAVYFYFDPNTLDAAGWKRLGLRDKTITTIQHYLSKGGVFRKPEDLGRIYGLFKDDYERLLPWIQINNSKDHEANAPKYEQPGNYQPADKPVYPVKRVANAAVVEINKADTSALIALPGIGSKLAARIINFRDKLGGFYSVQQVAETYGLSDSTFTAIRPLLQCNQPAVLQLNINTADANTLKQHPYIRWNLANLIVQYRAQHGPFASLDELLKLASVTAEWLEKTRPYLAL